MTRSAFARRCLSKRYLQELFTFSHSPKFFYSPLYTQKRNTVNCRVLACSKRSDSAERCEVKKAMKVEGDWRERCSPLLLPRFYFFALLFTSHRSPLSERLELASRLSPLTYEPPSLIYQSTEKIYPPPPPLHLLPGMKSASRFSFLD